MTMQKTAVLNVVGLSGRMLGSHTPGLSRFAAEAARARITPAFPAVTCTAQTDYLTGRYPERHGVVGNGWYSHEDCEIQFWRQADPLVQAPRLWSALRARDSEFTCANLFWWYNMYSAADYSVTPRPMYPADGRKIPDVYTHPGTLRDELQGELGTFPLFEFWGPRASIRSTQWIANAARRIEERFSPTLTLVYLPHLDYSLQRVGPGAPEIAAELAAVDAVAADLIAFYEARGARVVVLSEYGITEVRTPVHPNRALRERGLLAVRNERGHDMLDAGASAAFAVADHQVAHVYVNDRARLNDVRALMEQLPGVERVLGDEEKAARHIGHQRAGDLVLVAKPDAWFTYYFWMDDTRAPDYARTVDIHRKPGYDPVELVLDPAMRFPMLSVGWTLFKRSLGFRSLLEVTPLDATLVRGSHGRPDVDEADRPIVLTRDRTLVDRPEIASVDVYDLIARHVDPAFAR
jgi:predicted AlkP superfamily pyrophosphatase or phosphodiesterase